MEIDYARIQSRTDRFKEQIFVNSNLELNLIQFVQREFCSRKVSVEPIQCRLYLVESVNFTYKIVRYNTKSQKKKFLLQSL